jgi:tetratricopeptide (TPR) repeat protein
VSDPARVIPVLIGLSAHHVVSGEIRTAYDIALEMLSLFERLGDPNLKMIAEWSVGAAMFHLGQLERAHQHLERGLELYDPSFHGPRVWQTGIEPGIFCRCEFSRTLVLRGYPDRGLAAAREAVSQARALDHPQPLVFAMLFEIFARISRREPQEALTVFDQLATLCRSHGIAQELQWAVALRGRALIELGDMKQGFLELEEGLALHRKSRSALLRPYYLVLLAGGLIRLGRFEAAMGVLEEAATDAAATEQPAYESERARLEGTVFSRLGNREAEAEQAFRASLSIARAQGARWLELRGARAYADFLVNRGRTVEARTLLAPVLAWFTEGRTTMDYAYAEALLKTLEG